MTESESRYQSMLKVAEQNLSHALQGCSDPDCEIHNPEMQEDEAYRLNSLAFFFAGAQGMGKMLDENPEATLLDFIAAHAMNQED
jgi:hypothetical protein